MSETAKTRHIVAPYCTGNGVDLGSGGEPIVPWAIQFDLHRHCKHPLPPVQFVHSAVSLPFRDAILDFVYASHILEDFKDWDPLLLEWVRVLKPGGHLIIQVPHHLRYRDAVSKGQPDNKAHQHEALYMEEVWDSLRKLFPKMRVEYCGFVPIMDYNILTIARLSP
jgi:predicted SAM-dependent methyltransferase